MAGKQGGARPGAGRPKKQPVLDGKGYDAAGYLSAVIAGVESPNALRVAAAKALLHFQIPIVRAPLPVRSGRALAESAALAEDRARRRAFEEKAAAIHRKYNGSGD